MLESIIEFQKAGGHTVAYSTDNHIPSIEDRRLRLKLIFEELSELADAYGMDRTFADLCEKHRDEYWQGEAAFRLDSNIFNKVEALDALCDLSVVVNGGYCISGFTDIAQEAYDETMRSNMSKFCYSLDEALATVAGKDDWTYRVTNIDGRDVYVFLRKSDGKILKGKGFFQPDYSKLLGA
jgi:predicted HAD superfamily Cof-like phosphohydrolase